MSPISGFELVVSAGQKFGLAFFSDLESGPLGATASLWSGLGSNLSHGA